MRLTAAPLTEDSNPSHSGKVTNPANWNSFARFKALSKEHGVNGD